MELKITDEQKSRMVKEQSLSANTFDTIIANFEKIALSTNEQSIMDRLVKNNLMDLHIIELIREHKSK